MKQPIDLRPDHAKIVHEIIARHLPAGVSVRVFGSRAKWTAKPHSDLDLALKGKQPLPRSVLGDLAEAFSESDLPFRVDVVDWHAVAPRFQAVIDQDGKRLEFPFENIGNLASENNGAIAIGPFGSAMKADTYTDSGVRVIRGTNFGDTRTWKGDWVFVPNSFVEKMPRCEVRPGDLVFPHRGSIGEVAIVPDDGNRYCLSTSLMKATLDPQKSDPLFVCYYLKSPAGRQEIMRFGSTVGTPGIGQPLASLRQFNVPSPDLSTQKSIVSVLTALDDKIELNRRMNETLEGMAQAIFRDWFVDFGPVRRKAAGETDAVAIMGGLTPDPARAAELAANFPDAFGDDGLPVGFAFTNLGNATSVLETGKRPKGGIKGINSGVPSIGAESIVGLAKFDFTKTKYVPREFFEQMGRGVLGSRDILLYKDGGRPGEFEPHVAMFGAGFPYDEACINEHVYRLVGHGHFSQEYLYLHLTSDDTSEEMRRKGTGVAIPGLNSRAAASLRILDPKENLLAAFTDFAKPLFDLALSNASASKSLAETRDYLLPRLMSGTVRVARESEAA